jgi:hypothetical protein
MHALADEGRVVAERVAGEFARVFHKPLPPPLVRRRPWRGRPCSPQQQVGRHDSRPRLHKTVEWRLQSAVGGHRGPGSGLVEPSSELVLLGAPVSGLVEEVMVTEGQRVKKGDPLFAIDRRTGVVTLAKIARGRSASREVTVACHDNGVPRHALSRTFTVSVGRPTPAGTRE